MTSTEVPDPIYVLRQESETFHSLLFIEDSQCEYLLSGSENGQVLKWDLVSGRSVSSSTITTSSSPCLALHRTHNSLISQNKDGTVKFWYLGENSSCLATIKLDYFGFCKLDYNKDYNILVCPKQKSGLQVFSAETKREITVLNGESVNDGKLGEVMVCKITVKDGITYIIAAYESGDVATWDLDKRCITSQINLTGSDCPMAMDLDTRRHRGIIASNSDKLVVFRLFPLSKKHEMRMLSEGVSCVRLRPDCRVFVVGCWDGKVRVFETKSCRRLAVLDFHDTAILDVAFSHGEKSLLAAAAKDGKISLWNICN